MRLPWHIAPLALALAACEGPEPRGGSAEPEAGRPREALVLTGERPRVPFDPGPLPEGRALLELTLLSVAGADDAYVLRVAVAGDAPDGDPRELGQVTPFPPGQAASFSLAVPDELERALRAAPRAPGYFVELLPIAGDRALPERLAVELAAPRWRSEK